MRLRNDEKKKKGMTLGKAIEYFINFYYQAKDNPHIKKPFAWSLYNAWLIVNEQESEE